MARAMKATHSGASHLRQIAPEADRCPLKFTLWPLRCQWPSSPVWNQVSQLETGAFALSSWLDLVGYHKKAKAGGQVRGPGTASAAAFATPRGW